MNKDWLWELEMRALDDLSISSDALRLLLMLCKRQHRNIRSRFPEPFKLSMADAVAMIGYVRHSQETGYKLVRELIKAGYLKKMGVRGSPPTTEFMVPNCRQPKAIDCRQPKADHISNSFQEDIKTYGRNSRAGEVNGSLRSKGTKGNELAAAPKMTDAEREAYAAKMRVLKKNLKPT